MIRRTFLKCLVLVLSSTCLMPLRAFAQVVVGQVAKSLGLVLSTPGRVGFYIDYSELDTIGEHTFYVCRTHGTAGSVSVDFSTHGDSHSQVTGTLTWGDGDASIKSFKVSVGSKGSGEHRIYAKLSNPVGGVALHNGVNTQAYGVIDDDTIAPDSQAVFFDTNASLNGNGTQASPYDNIYDAIGNVGSKRYIYGKGTVTPDGTNTGLIGGTFNCITPPAGRASEETRVYIRNWPGNTLVVDGAGASNINGFFTEGGESYQTYRGIQFKNINVTGVAGFNNGAAIFYNYGSSTMINIELCSADNINGSTNDGAYMLWGVDGGKVWRCTSNNIQDNGNNTHQNTAGVFYYSSTNLSIQRCEFTNSGNGIFMKRMEAGDVVASVRFNKIKTINGVRYGYGSSGQEPNYGIVQSNLFKDCNIYQAIEHTGAGPNQKGKQWICNNVFDSCGGGDNGAIRSTDTYNHQIFNNIFYNCVRTWDMPEYVPYQSNQSASQIEYADYNHEHGSIRDLYRHLSIKYTTLEQIRTATGFAVNDRSGDPKFINPSLDDYRLDIGSPCIGGGVASTNQGLYLIGVEKVGLSGAALEPSPSSPSDVAVS